MAANEVICMNAQAAATPRGANQELKLRIPRMYTVSMTSPLAWAPACKRECRCASTSSGVSHFSLDFRCALISANSWSTSSQASKLTHEGTSRHAFSELTLDYLGPLDTCMLTGLMRMAHH